ncbi:MAG: hypothetical protein QGH40_16170 [bacterium]|jgi:type II secretory pathway pseudopilin PulG|nr:hypothetical protein [bacterium]
MKPPGRGYGLISVLILVLVLQISLSVAYPIVSTAVKRSREQELRFCLKEFKKAIEKFKWINGRYPHRLEELLVIKDDIRFIRRMYSDPMTGEKKWQPVLQNRAGSQKQEKEIVNVRSCSEAISITGVQYNQWYFSNKLELCVAGKPGTTNH